MKWNKLLLCMALLCCSLSIQAYALESEDESIYTLVNLNGNVLTQRAGKMYADDEYISGDNQHYKIISVDDDMRVATAQLMEDSEIESADFSAFDFSSALAEDDAEKNANDSKKLICMYSTHSDESYTPNDGDSSLWENAGIYDVGHALKDELESLGIDVIYSEETFLPHDADAYNRSRGTAEELLKKGPDALLDIHRDAIPAEQYETTVDGEDVSMIRLFVGRSNQNSAANKAFAQEIKKIADEEYPGLIKDIYIGKGNYNQELYPQALLLEMGTHEIEKDKVVDSTKYLANVLDQVLYGGTAKAEEEPEQNRIVGKSILWVVVLAIVAAAVYGLVSSGSFGGMWNKLKRGVSEITGGAIGKKRK